MLPNGRRLGVHLPLGSGMVRAADRAASIGASALQVFSDNPTSWRRRPSLPGELPAFRDRVAKHDLAPLAIHAPYLVNLASPDDDVHERSVELIVNELLVAAAYGARFVNVHTGSHRGAGLTAGVSRLAAAIRRVFDQLDGRADDTVLVLENSAGGGSGIGATVEELGGIAAALEAAGVPRARLGFCLDSAHAWGAGYRIDTAGGVDALVDGYGAAVGLDRLLMVHLNDSRSEPGSLADRHQHIGAGRIGAAGLGRLLLHPGLGHVAYYLETPGMEAGYDAVNLARAQDVAAGRPLDELPPEAFLTRGASRQGGPEAGA